MRSSGPVGADGTGSLSARDVRRSWRPRCSPRSARSPCGSRRRRICCSGCVLTARVRRHARLRLGLDARDVRPGLPRHRDRVHGRRTRAGGDHGLVPSPRRTPRPDERTPARWCARSSRACRSTSRVRGARSSSRRSTTRAVSPPSSRPRSSRVLAIGVAARILANQVRSTQAGADGPAGAGREGARARGDRPRARTRSARPTRRCRESEEHLRLVFEAAVDGIVELDQQRRDPAGERRLLRHGPARPGDRSRVSRGRRSPRPSTGADASFASLPATGQGTIQRREGQPLYLESRISEVPTTPPRRLLLVRDVTAGQGRRPDDPLAVQVPAGPRRGPDAAAAPDEQRHRGRAQPHRARPPRRPGAGRVGGVALARGGPADAQGRRHRRAASRSSRRSGRSSPRRPTTSAA